MQWLCSTTKKNIAYLLHRNGNIHNTIPCGWKMQNWQPTDTYASCSAFHQRFTCARYVFHWGKTSQRTLWKSSMTLPRSAIPVRCKKCLKDFYQKCSTAPYRSDCDEQSECLPCKTKQIQQLINSCTDISNRLSTYTNNSSTETIHLAKECWWYHDRNTRITRHAHQLLNRLLCSSKIKAS